MQRPDHGSQYTRHYHQSRHYCGYDYGYDYVYYYYHHHVCQQRHDPDT